MEIIATNALISINETFLVQLVSFLIFLYVMNRIMFKPLLSTMEQREDYLDHVKQEILAGQAKLDQLVTDLDAQRAQVIRDANAMALALEAEGDRTAAELIEEARQKITTLRHETETHVASQVQQARQTLAGEVETVTVAVMEKVLQRRLSS